MVFLRIPPGMRSYLSAILFANVIYAADYRYYHLRTQ
jgi:hypothetical protein